MNFKEFVADYLNFSRRDRIAIISILIILSGIFFLPDAISKTGKSRPVATDTAWVAALKKIELKVEENDNQQNNRFADDNHTAYQYDRPVNKYYNNSKGELFYFDPNSLPIEGWQRLGLRDKTISTIQNYLSKGGKFRKPEDLQRVYGLFPNEYERLAPYIKIELMAEANNFKDFKDNLPTENPTIKTYAPRYSVVDINTADTTALIALPGIGSKLAARIINFRDKLGGFYSLAQVGETFGLPDSTFQKIKQYLKLETSSLKKININKATVDELKMHPYIKYSLANPIVAYRIEHGPFAIVGDIKKVMAITDEIYNKIEPYLTIE